MRIGYMIMDCPLGRMLVGATERGVCSVGLGDDDEALEARLRRRVSGGGDRALGRRRDRTGSSVWAEALLKHIEAGQPSVSLPLDIQVTAFQGRVYSALRTIANGETRSYSAIARQIGEPKAARAVARACATNPVPLTVPCHRVIREDGDIGGYGGGVERKRKLLGDARARPFEILSTMLRQSLHGGQAARTVTKAG